MKSYEFLCGGDRGAWECYVDVELTEEDESILKDFAKDYRNEHVSQFEPTDKIYSKVVDELSKQCEYELNMNSLVIWVPNGFKDEL